jgi:DNA-binding transcriptional ArsR family regulator
MSAPVTRRPVRGPMFAAAVRLPIEGQKRRRILALLGAYADAGVNDPAIRELAVGAKLPKPAVCRLVDVLEQDGLVEIARRAGHDKRNIYRLTFGPEGAAAHLGREGGDK